MATPPNDDTKVLFRLLVDQQWHSYWEVRDAIAKTIPPGRALRKYEEGVSFRRRYKHGNDPSYDSNLTEQDRIEYGARSCAGITITSWTRSGALLRRGEGRDKEIRVKPGWTSWGIPGYEPGTGEQDSAHQEQGDVARSSTDRPPEDSEPLETAPVHAQEPSPAVEVVPETPTVVPGEGLAESITEFRVLPRLDRVSLPLPPVAQASNPAWVPGGIPVPAESPLACSRCGLAVGDRGVHDRWHAESVNSETPAELSLLNESQLKDLLSKEVIDAIGVFEENQRMWLAERFTELEHAIIGLKRGYLRFSFVEGK